MKGTDPTKFAERCRKAWEAASDVFQEDEDLPSHRRWRKAREARLGLPPHPPLLRPWRPQSGDPWGLEDEGALQGFDPDAALLLDAALLKLSPPQQQALSRALERGRPDLAWRVFEPDRRLEGYPWYDSVPRISSVQALGKFLQGFVPLEGEEPSMKEARPREIVIRVKAGKAIRFDLTADLAYPRDCSDPMPVLAQGAEIDAQDLAEIMERSFFDSLREKKRQAEQDSVTHRARFGDLMLGLASAALDEPLDTVHRMVDRISRREIEEALGLDHVAVVEILARTSDSQPRIAVRQEGDHE